MLPRLAQYTLLPEAKDKMPPFCTPFDTQKLTGLAVEAYFNFLPWHLKAARGCSHADSMVKTTVGLRRHGGEYVPPEAPASFYLMVGQALLAVEVNRMLLLLILHCGLQKIKRQSRDTSIKMRGRRNSW